MFAKSGELIKLQVGVGERREGRGGGGQVVGIPVNMRK